MNQTNVFDNNIPLNPHLSKEKWKTMNFPSTIFSILSVNNYNPNQNYLAAQGSWQSNNPNAFPQNLTNNYYPNPFAPNLNPQLPPNAGYNPYLQQQAIGSIGPGVGVGVLVSDLEWKDCLLNEN